MDIFDLPQAEPVRKVKTKTVVVVATTKPPTPGFRVRGQVVGFGEEARVPVADAADLLRRGKCRIVEGSEKVELL
jgi:hypothetical protein